MSSSVASSNPTPPDSDPSPTSPPKSPSTRKRKSPTTNITTTQTTSTTSADSNTKDKKPRTDPLASARALLAAEIVRRGIAAVQGDSALPAIVSSPVGQAARVVAWGRLGVLRLVVSEIARGELGEVLW